MDLVRDSLLGHRRGLLRLRWPEGSGGRVYLQQVFPLGTDKTQGGEVLCSR